MLTNCPCGCNIGPLKPLSIQITVGYRNDILPTTKYTAVIMTREVSSCTAVLSYCREFELTYFGKLTSRGMWRRVARPGNPDVSVDRIVFIFRPWRSQHYDRSKRRKPHDQRYGVTHHCKTPKFGIWPNPSSLRVGSDWQNTCLKLSTWTYNVCGHLSVWHWFVIAKQPN
jgi:hypothetical protein